METVAVESTTLTTIAYDRHREVLVWPILQRPDWLLALEGRSVPEGGHVGATVATIPRDELMRLLDEN